MSVFYEERVTMVGMTTKRLLVCAGTVGAIGLITAPAAAQQDWIGTGPTLFYDTPTNWNPAQTPNSDEDVTFGTIDLAGQQIFVNANSQSNGISFFNNNWDLSGAATATLSGGAVTIDDPTGTTLANGTNVTASDNLTWDNSGNVIVGGVGYGSLTVEEASDFFGRQFFIGNSATGVGELTLTGDNTIVRANLASNTGVFTIGRLGGTGTINVLNGADLRTNSTGANDIWVGGYLDDDDGPGVVSSTGTLNVDGVGSFAETEDLNVGIFGGVGFLNITNGGQIINTDGGTNGSPDTTFGANNGFGGAQSQGFGVVDGDGSLLRSRSIFVGNSGIGGLDVRGGGEARTLTQGSSEGNLFIGNAAGSIGKAAVHGTASDGTTNSLMDVDQDLVVGSAGFGVLNVGLDLADNEVGTGSLQVDVNLIIGDSVGNTAANKVVISGSGTTANVGGFVRAGQAGNGSLEVLNGATLTVGSSIGSAGLPSGTGSILIDGPGTTVAASTLFTGNANNNAASVGDMTISNQAVLTLTGTNSGVVTIADDGQSVGTVTVTGAGSLLQSTGGTAEWWVGGSSNEDGGVGTLNVLDGASAIAPGRILLGYRGGASGTLNIDGAGSQVDANGDFVLVGFGATGALNVTNGGVLNTDNMFVADGAGSTGSQLDIDGPGSVVNLQGLLHVGDTNRGLVNVTNGGVLNVALGGATDRLVIGDEGGADGSSLTIDGPGSRVEYFGTERVSVGLSGGAAGNRAALTVTNGGVLNAVQRDQAQAVISSGFLMVADETGSNGQVTVDGVGSRIDVRYMQVGDGPSSANGVVDITDGGVITALEHVEVGSNGSGVGTININGVGSGLLVGDYIALGDDVPGNGSATGTINITDGGQVLNAGQAYIGRRSGSFGTATLGSTTADDSVWDIGGELTIAGTEGSSQNAGSGTLNLNPGGVVNVTSNLRIRNLGDVNLSGGEINVGGDLILTDAGSTINFVFGKLALNNPAGATLAPSDLERLLAVGGGNRPTLFTNMELAVAGEATLGGPLRISGGTFSVGAMSNASFQQLDFDTGTLNITASDLVINASGPYGADLAVAPGQTLNVTQNVAVSTGSTLTIVGGYSAGTTNLVGDLIIVNSETTPKTFGGGINSGANATITLIGDVLFDGSVGGPAQFFGPGNAIFAGTFAPGASPAAIAFEGGVGVSSTGTLQIEIGGAAPSTEHDQLNAVGDADLAGQIDLALIDGFVPALGDSFTVLTSAGLNGTTFDSVGGVLAAPGLALAVTYTTTDVIVTAATPGDADLDGDIDDTDLGLAISNFTGPGGGGNTWAQGDSDGDGDVDDTDLGVAISGFTGPLSPNAVPEPGSLVILAGLLGLTRRRRSRSGA